MDFDIKEELLLRNFKELFEEEIFDENDIIAFYIFVRRHINQGNDFPYIKEMGDTIAHRKRNKGYVKDAMRAAIENRYQPEHGSTAVKGYHGMCYDRWKEEWNALGHRLNIHFSETAIRDIMICTFSILHFSRYDIDDHHGHIEIMQAANNTLTLITTEDHPSSYRVWFAFVPNIYLSKNILLVSLKRQL